MFIYTAVVFNMGEIAPQGAILCVVGAISVSTGAIYSV